MNTHDAATLARALMDEHAPPGWKFTYDNARRRFGQCRYRTKTISLSRPLVELNDETAVRDTILHEIAHANTPGAHHGARWKAEAKRLGADPTRCYDSATVTSPPKKYVAVCADCGAAFYRDRPPKNASCPKHGPGYHAAYRLTWQANIGDPPTIVAPEPEPEPELTAAAEVPAPDPTGPTPSPSHRCPCGAPLAQGHDRCSDICRREYPQATVTTDTPTTVQTRLF